MVSKWTGTCLLSLNNRKIIIFRLRTGHNRLPQHMYKRFKVGDSEICPCGQAPQNTEHGLQTCSSHRQLRARAWPNHTAVEKKLYGTTEELALTEWCSIGSHCLTVSCRKNEEGEEEEKEEEEEEETIVILFNRFKI